MLSKNQDPTSPFAGRLLMKAALQFLKWLMTPRSEEEMNQRPTATPLEAGSEKSQRIQAPSVGRYVKGINLETTDVDGLTSGDVPFGDIHFVWLRACPHRTRR